MLVAQRNARDPKPKKRKEQGDCANFCWRVKPRDQWQGAYADQLGHRRSTAEHEDAAVNRVLRFEPAQKTLEAGH